MYSPNGFIGYMTAYAPFMDKNDQHMFKVIFKHESFTPLQTLLKSLDQAVDINGKYSYNFTDPIIWSNIEYKDINLKTSVVVEGTEPFIAILDKIKVTQKETNDRLIFTYTISMIKEVGVENEDAQIISAFLKIKEENEEGKLKAKPLNISFQSIE
jgi:hypothetical protein